MIALLIYITYSTSATRRAASGLLVIYIYSFTPVYATSISRLVSRLSLLPISPLLYISLSYLSLLQYNLILLSSLSTLYITLTVAIGP